MSFHLLSLATAMSVAAMSYVLYAIWRVDKFRQRRPAGDAYLPSVTLLKPLCGVDAELYDNLRSFCRLDYPVYQIVFGVRDSADPAIAVAERIREEFPERDITIVIDHRIRGANPKVSNLLNMFDSAKHDVFAISDSDMRVDPDYLARVVAPLAEPKVGVVTCLYAGRPANRKLATRLASMFINDWFLPSVLVAVRLRSIDFCMGSTMAFRRDAIEAIGGLDALRSYLADDYMLGNLLARRGYEVHLSDYVVENLIFERSLWSALHRELRWARTIRTLRPMGYAMSFLMYTMSVSVGAALLLDQNDLDDPFGLGLIAAAVLLRLALHYRVRKAIGTGDSCPAWLLPLRDILGFGVWAASFFGRGVNWRGQELLVNQGGILVFAKEGEVE